MPIYEYQCRDCGHILEALQKISDEPLKECPICNKDTLGKLVSASSFQLKGTGWYATDFKTKPQQAATPEGKPATTEPAPPVATVPAATDGSSTKE
jgi:putative FmdB family regulatory protein